MWQQTIKKIFGFLHFHFKLRPKFFLGLFLGLVLLFTVGPRLMPPTIMTSFPGHNATEVSLDSRIEIIFDRPANKIVAEKTLNITPKIEGEISWEGEQKLLFTPKTPLQRGQTYQVKLNQLVASYNIVFATIGDPKVLVNSPQNESLEDLAPITVVFDRPMIPLTTATNSGLRTPAFTVFPEVIGEGKWLGTTAYQLIPTKPLRRATTYTVTIQPNLKSADGGIMTQNFSWQFSSLRPRVIASSPVLDFKYASPIASVAAFFNMAIDPSSAQNHFKLFNDRNQQVSGTIKISNSVLGFYPSQPLTREKGYHAVVSAGLSGFEGPNGTEQNYDFNFTVSPSPKIISTTPISGSTNVTETNFVKVTFNVPMDDRSFEQNINIIPKPDRKATLSYYPWNDDNTLSIGTYLNRLTNYSITLTDKIKDQSGFPLSNPQTVVFSTAEYQPAISIQPFGSYFASFNQQIIPRIVTQVSNAPEVQYSLYRLKTADFNQLYQRRYGQFCGSDESCRNWQSVDLKSFEKVKGWSEYFDRDPATPVNVITKVSNPNGGLLPSGLYFLDARLTTGQHDNLVMIISRATITVKKSNQEIFVWAVDQSTGEVIPNFNLTLDNVNGGTLASGTTNSDGVWQKDIDLANAYDLLIYGQGNQDSLVAASSWGQGINRNDFGLPYHYESQVISDYRNPNNRYRVFATLDRPIYRPGNKVHFKGLIKKDNDAAYENLPPETKVAIVITDSMGREILNQMVSINSFGSFTGSLELSPNAATGQYTFIAKYNENGINQPFQVEEYRKPDMLLKLKPTQDSFLGGQPISVKLNAAYYFGAPIINTVANWSASTSDFTFKYGKDRRFDFGDPEEDWYRWFGYNAGSQKQIASGRVVTNEQGDAVIDFSFDMSKYPNSQQVSVEAQTSDQSNQSVGSSNEFIVHKADRYIGLRAVSYSGLAGQDSKIQLVALDPNEKELAGIPINLKFFKRIWTAARELDQETGEYRYVNNHTDTEVAANSVTTDNFGFAESSFTPREGGTYKVLATTNDAAGNLSRSSTYLWISGSGLQTARENNDRILVIPDKKDYFVGETASLFVNSPFASSSATTLITAERNKVLGYQIVKASDISNNFRIPVNPNYSPNIYLGATLIRGGQEVKMPPEIKVGYVEVKVTDKRKHLAVEIRPEKTTYLPGETLNADIITKDDNGNPVSSEVAVGLVDKAVWDLSGINLPEIYQYFYQPRNLEVDTAQLLTISMDRINQNTNLGAKGGSGGCFTGDTKVLMANGVSLPISEIKVGDMVLSKTASTSPNLSANKVTAVFSHLVDRYLIINGHLKVTPVHLLYVNSHWKMAGELVIGDTLIDSGNRPEIITNIEQVFAPQTKVYNLTVESTRTYFANNIYVHNCKGGDGPCVADTTRKNFPETAYWNPNLVTSANGQAKVSIKLPGSLTTWRLGAIANSAQAAFGSNSLEIVTTQNILIRPALPRFLNVSDEAKIGAIIVNTTSQAQTVGVTVTATGANINANNSSQAVIGPNGQQKFLWSTKALATNSATIKFTARTGGNNTEDSLEVTLPVRSYSIPEVVATAGKAANEALEKINLPADIDRTQGKLDVSLSPSLGTSSLSSLTWLLDYQYFCTEQIASKILPAVYGSKLLKKAGLTSLGGIKLSELEQMVSDGIQRLNGTQHPDGGWGWWNDTSSNPNMTAYAFMALMTAKNAKFNVDLQTLNKGQNYLIDLISKDSNLDSVQKINILYALESAAGKNLGDRVKLFRHRFELPLESRVKLYFIMKNGGQKGEANQLYSEVVSFVKKTATTSHWEERGLGSIGPTQWVLSMLTEENPHNPLIGEVIRYLLSVRSDNNWGGTMNTALVTSAILNQVLSINQGNLNESIKLTLNGQAVLENSLGNKDILNILTYSTPVSSLKIGTDNNLSIAKSGTGELYYSLSLKYYLPFSQINSLDQGLVVSRELLNAQGLPQSQSSILEGADGFIRLTVVSPAYRNHVIVEDFLPAGLEGVNNSLKNVVSVGSQPPKIYNPNSYPSYTPSYFNHLEYRDDKTVLFAEFLPPGVYQVIYKVRATTPGKYHHLPTQAYEMYFPDVSGHSDGGWFTVLEK